MSNKEELRDAIAEGLEVINAVREQHAVEGSDLFEDLSRQLSTTKAELARLQVLERDWLWKQENEGVAEREQASLVADLQAKILKLQQEKVDQSATNELLVNQTEQFHRDMQEKDEEFARAKKEWELEREKDSKSNEQMIKLVGQVELMKKQLDEAKADVDSKDKEIESLKRHVPDRQNEGKPIKPQRDAEADAETEAASTPAETPADKDAFKNKLAMMLGAPGAPRAPMLQRSTTGTDDVRLLTTPSFSSHQLFCTRSAQTAL
jgi:hypothetical protein